jgi:hypothetical protein
MTPVRLARRHGAALGWVQFNVRSDDLLRTPTAFPDWNATGFVVWLGPSTTTTATGWVAG